MIGHNKKRVEYVREAYPQKLNKDEADYDRTGLTAPKGERCALCEWFCGDDKPCWGLFGKTVSDAWCAAFELRKQGVVILDTF